MAFHNLLSKCDRALVAYLISQGAGTADDVFPGKRSLDKSAPCTVCFCESGTPISRSTYTVIGSIMINTSAVDDVGAIEGEAKLSSEDRVAAAFDAMHIDLSESQSGDQLAELITTAGRGLGGDMDDFTVINVILKGPEQGFNEKGACWVDTLNFELVACPNDVS